MKCDMLVSILIPSRKRLTKLVRCINSIHLNARTGDKYEILVWFDDDDADSLEQIPNLEIIGVRCFSGPRKKGYGSLADFVEFLEQQATGTFIWQGNDDMVVNGDWYGELAKVPTTGFIVQPEISQLNTSKYPMAEGQAFPIVPRQCWKQYTDRFPQTFDTEIDQLLRSNGWKTWFLKGVTFWHDRDENEIVNRDNPVV